MRPDVKNFRMSPQFQRNNEMRKSLAGTPEHGVTTDAALRKRITLPHVSIQDKPYVRTDPAVHRGIRSIRKHG